MAEDLNELELLIRYLAAAYPRMKIRSKTIQLYTRLLSDLPLESLRLALRYIVSTKRYFPTIAEIRETVRLTDQQASLQDKKHQRELMIRCQHCDQNGFRFIKRGLLTGVVRCNHS